MKKQVSVQQGYELWAQSYDEESNILTALDDKNSQLRLSAIYSLEVRASALDIGCGTGRNIPMLEEHFEEVVGVDFSKSMLSRASTKKKKTTTHFILQDFSNFSSNKKYDFVNCSLAMMHFYSVEKFISSVQNILKPGGILYITDAAESLLLLGSTPNFDRDEINYYLDHQIHRTNKLILFLQQFKFEIINLVNIRCEQEMIKMNSKYSRYLGLTCLFALTARKVTE